MNFFIGSNNSGKSTVLNFISHHVSGSKGLSFDPLERHDLNPNLSPTIDFGIPKNYIRESISKTSPQAYQKVSDLMDKLIDGLSDEEGLIWYSMEPSTRKYSIILSHEWDKIIPHNSWQTLWINFSQYISGGNFETWSNFVIEKMSKSFSTNFPKSNLIPAIREISSRGNDFADYTGAKLIDRLAEIQNPAYDRREDRRSFDKINEFLANVTGHTDAKIEIPHGREHVLVHMNGRVLPLSALGTGIHEVIMIASFCTISSNEIICIEEPELHLHPLMQRKLANYLLSKTDNQYFIATHSAAFIDTPGSSIFHVKLRDGLTSISRTILNKDRHEICLDLGYKASDLVQSNAIIWVEGPSDRIYIKHWLRKEAPHLLEGTHYSIMFYGGRLLSHLSADDDILDDFISLRSLNRNTAIVIDSDRRNSNGRINDTKSRIRGEFSAHGGVAWVTRGREIENYVDHAHLQEAVKSVVGKSYGSPLGNGLYDHALHYERATPKARRTTTTTTDLTERNVDKVAVARAISSREANLDVLDLRSRIRELADLIERANA